MAGYGVALAVKDIYADAFGERNLDSDLVDLMVKDGRQGKLLNICLFHNLIFSYMMANLILLCNGTNQLIDECTFCIFLEK